MVNKWPQKLPFKLPTTSNWWWWWLRWWSRSYIILLFAAKAVTKSSCCGRQIAVEVLLGDHISSLFISKRFQYYAIIVPTTTFLRCDSVGGGFIILLRYITATNHPLRSIRSTKAGGLMDGFSGFYWVTHLRFGVGTQCFGGHVIHESSSNTIALKTEASPFWLEFNLGLQWKWFSQNNNNNNWTRGCWWMIITMISSVEISGWCFRETKEYLRLLSRPFIIQLIWEFPRWLAIAPWIDKTSY